MIKNKILNFFSKQEAVAPIRNKLMMIWSDEIFFYNQRVVREKLRVKENRAHVVYYFHSLSDPYSHLTINILEKLISNFNIEIKIFFVSEPPQSITPERGMYKKHCLKDAAEIAGWHGLKFKATSYFPKENEVLAYKILNYFSKINQNEYIFHH
jgi:2-hydroxychromene-2-carboxylate isomerase